MLPLAMLVLVRGMPPSLMTEFRARAEAASARPVSRAGAALVIAVWLSLAALLWFWWA